MKKYLVLVISILVVVVGVVWYWYFLKNQSGENTLSKNVPLQQAPDLGNAKEKENLIHVSSPKPNEIIKSPLLVTGEARGTWFFEASFPVKILDANGKVLGQSHAQEHGDWMTENFVPFDVPNLAFEQPTTKTGWLILEKDNPSGLPEKDDQLRIPVNF